LSFIDEIFIDQHPLNSENDSYPHHSFEGTTRFSVFRSISDRSIGFFPLVR